MVHQNNYLLLNTSVHISESQILCHLEPSGIHLFQQMLSKSIYLTSNISKYSFIILLSINCKYSQEQFAVSQINVAGITSKYFSPKVGFTASLWKLSTNLEFTNSKKGNLHSILDPKFIPYFNCLSRNEKLNQHQWWKTDENAKTDFVIFLQTDRQAVSWPLFWFYTSLLMSITMTIRLWLTQLWISTYSTF